MDVIGVEEEVRQVEELWDQLSDITHVVPGGRLPLLPYVIKHPLWDVEASLCRDKSRCITPSVHRRTKLCNQLINNKHIVPGLL